jgi:hypothetical protein
MARNFRRRVERFGMATIGILTVMADLFGWLERVLPPDSLPKITFMGVSSSAVAKCASCLSRLRSTPSGRSGTGSS